MTLSRAEVERIRDEAEQVLTMLPTNNREALRAAEARIAEQKRLLSEWLAHDRDNKTACTCGVVKDTRALLSEPIQEKV